MNMAKISEVLSSAIIAGLVVTGCATGDTDAFDTDRDLVALQFWVKSETGSFVSNADTLPEYLPNQSFVVDGEEAVPLSAGAIHGTVESVIGLDGFTISDEDETATTSFDAKDAQWRTVQLTVAVKEGTEGFKAGELVNIGLAITAELNTEKMLQGLEDMGEIVAILKPLDSENYRGQAYGVARNGVLLGEVKPDGTIWFDAFNRGFSYEYEGWSEDPENLEADKIEQEFLDGITTVDDLFSEASLEKEPITLDSEGLRE